ncbi:unnamed protein product [Effrenium voratum]|uniref:Pentatricopeptide repeat-containing protein, chloroplastic n=2 Tax=Effrenium voratum TaxID=2562239 RepID=A0AA36JK76_9DINO|nr:unnamed protein product [Effrenium voratum]
MSVERPASLWSTRLANLEADSSVVTYTGAIAALRPKQWRIANLILAKMGLSRVEANIVTYSSCAKSTPTSWPRARHLLSQSRQVQLQPDLIFWNSSLSCHARVAQWLLAVNLFSGLASEQRDVCSYNALLSSYEVAQEWQRASDLLSEVGCDRVQADVISFNTTMSAYGKSMCWEEALQLLSASDAPNVISYSSALTACERSAGWQQALALLSDTRDRDTIVYSAAISACEKADQWQSALRLLFELEKSGKKSDLIAYSAAISACEKGRQWRQALQLFRQLRSKGWRVDLITYHAVLSACENAGKWQEALDLLRAANHELQISTMTYNVAISACEKACQWHVALALFADLSRTPLLAPDEFTFSALLMACAAVGKARLALALVAELCDRSDAVTYEASLRVAAHHDPHQAVALLAKLKADFVRRTFGKP